MTGLVERYLRSGWARWVAVLLLLASVFVPLFVVPYGMPNPYHLDYDVYRTGAEVFLHGGELYGELPSLEYGKQLPFTYPPIAAAVFTVFIPLPLWLGSLIFVAISILCVFVVLRIVLGRVVDRPARDLLWLAVPATTMAIWLQPLRDTFSYGQVTIVLMTLVVVDAMRCRGRWWSGMLTGLAIAIKLTPLVFVLLFVLRRDWRTAAVSVLTALALHGIGYLLAYDDSVRYWTRTLPETNRIGDPAFANNQSLTGELHRLGIGSTAVWLVCATLVGLGIAVVAWRLLRADVHAGAMCAVAMCALYCSPVAWDHHWVWCAPLLVLLVAWAVADRAAAQYWWTLVVAGLLVFLLAPHQRLPGADVHWNWLEHVVGSSYLIWGIAVLIAMGVRASRLPPDVDSPTRQPLGLVSARRSHRIADRRRTVVVDSG